MTSEKPAPRSRDDPRTTSGRGHPHAAGAIGRAACVFADAFHLLALRSYFVPIPVADGQKEPTMSNQKPQQTGKAPPPEERDDLALDPEVVKDLEPRERAGEVRGGGIQSSNSPIGMSQMTIGSNSDVRLKESVEVVGEALARLRALAAREEKS